MKKKGRSKSINHRKSEKPTFILRTDKMEKLIKLLNEYDGTPTEWKQIGDKIYFDGLGGNSELHELIIISKYYGFIQRLVDNDKIDRDRILKENGQFRLFYYDLERVKNYDRLVMYLSVEDNPIEFLVSILK